MANFLNSESRILAEEILRNLHTLKGERIGELSGKKLLYEAKLISQHGKGVVFVLSQDEDGNVISNNDYYTLDVFLNTFDCVEWDLSERPKTTVPLKIISLTEASEKKITAEEEKEKRKKEAFKKATLAHLEDVKKQVEADELETTLIILQRRDGTIGLLRNTLAKYPGVMFLGLIEWAKHHLLLNKKQRRR